MKIRDLVTDAMAESNPALQRLRQSCLASDPRQILRAFRRKSSIIKVMSAISHAESGTLTHETVDTLGSELEMRHVRSLLVTIGALPRRDEQLARFEQWCEEAAPNVSDADHRRTLMSFARWVPLRELRMQDSPVTTGQCQWRRAMLRDVIDLLNWLSDQGDLLADLDQGRLEFWRAQVPRRKVRVKAFCDWAARNRHCTKLSFPRSESTVRVPIGVSTDERIYILEHLITNDAVDVRMRFAGILIVLFGVRVHSIHQLRTSDIVDIDGRVSVSLGPVPLILPDDIGAIALAARDLRKSPPRLLSDSVDDEWLFPGQAHGRPLSKDAMNYQLKAAGVQIRAARTGALVSLVQELPPTVISRLTGLDVSSVISWAAAVAASNSRYTGMLE